MVRRLTVDERRLLGMRVRAQLLAEPAASPADAVGWMLSMQAQDWFGSLWAVAQRSADATVADVEAAQARGEIVRSWPVRGTLHWTRAEDVRWLSLVTADRVDRRDATRARSLGIDDASFAAVRGIADRVLADGPAPRQTLLDAFVAAGQPVEQQRGPLLLGWLARHGHVVMTSRTDYALHDAWVRAPRDLVGDEALAELALRYLTSHGPATAHDLAWWAGLTIADARRGIDVVRHDLDELVLDGTTYLHATGLEPADGVHLLAAFDELVLGYADRSSTLRGEPLDRVLPSPNGLFLATVVVDGAVSGTWRRTQRASGIVIDTDAWMTIPARRRPALRRSVRAYGAAHGAAASLG